MKSIIKRFRIAWNLIGLILMILGLPQILEQISQWGRMLSWIKERMNIDLSSDFFKWVFLTSGFLVIVVSNIDSLLGILKRFLGKTGRWKKGGMSTKNGFEHLIPLKEAAAVLYDAETPDDSSDIVRIVEQQFGEFRRREAISLDEGILINVGTRIIRRLLYIPIFGKRLPGIQLREISAEARKHVERLVFKNDIASFKSNYPDRDVTFSNILIKNSDLNKIVENLRKKIRTLPKVKSAIDTTHDFFKYKIGQAECLRVRGLNDTGFLYEASVENWKQEVIGAITEAFGTSWRDSFIKGLPTKRTQSQLLVATGQFFTDRDHLRLTLEHSIDGINELIRDTFTENFVQGFVTSSLEKYAGASNP